MEIEDKKLIDKYNDILYECSVLQKKKNSDYNANGLIFYADYFRFLPDIYEHMLWAKVLRLMAVKSKKDPENESIEDTLMDIINYAALALARRRLNE